MRLGIDVGSIGETFWHHLPTTSVYSAPLIKTDLLVKACSIETNYIVESWFRYLSCGPLLAGVLAS